MPTELYSSPQAAETAFYEALERADLEAMMRVWEGGEDVTCIHPGGHLLSGQAAVRASWQQIFSAGSRLQFYLTLRRAVIDQTVAVHLVEESIVSGNRRYPPVTTTNVYRLTTGGWRMIVHHACPSPPGDPTRNRETNLH